MADNDKVRENRLRRMAERQGLRLVKSRRRDEFASGYGTYMLVSAPGTEMSDGADTTYGFDLDEIEKQLRGQSPRRADPPVQRRTGRMEGRTMEHPGPDTSLQISIVHLDGQVELALRGELDAASASALSEHLDQLIAEGHRDLRLNLSALTFLDAGGVAGLINYRRALNDLGGRLSLVAVSGIPLTVLTICKMLDTFGVETHGSDRATNPDGTNR